MLSVLRTIAAWCVSLLWFLCTPLLAPQDHPPTIIAAPPAYGIGVSIDRRVVIAIAKIENCADLNNPGCMLFAHQRGATRGRGGYARFVTRELGMAALTRWWEHRACVPIRASLKAYNPARPDYADIVLRVAGLRGDELLGICLKNLKHEE